MFNVRCSNTTNDKRSNSRTDSRFAQTRVSRHVWQLAETGIPALSEDCVRKDVAGRVAGNYRLAACVPQRESSRYPETRVEWRASDALTSSPWQRSKHRG